MSLWGKLVLDMGVYAAVLSVYAAAMMVTAGPTRALNRYFAVLLLEIGGWQAIVAMARTTQNYDYWVPKAAPSGGFILMSLILVHDAVLYPHAASIWARLKRDNVVYALVACVIYYVAHFLAYAQREGLGESPIILRLLCAILMALSAISAYRRRRRAPRVNYHEQRLFNITAVFLFYLFVVFVFMRSPIGSRVLSASTIAYICWVISLLLSEQVLGVRGVTRLTLWHGLAFAVHSAFTCLLIWGYVSIDSQYESTARSPEIWRAAVILVAANYVLSFPLQALLRRAIYSRAARARGRVRDAALEATNAATNGPDLLQLLHSLAGKTIPGSTVHMCADGVGALPPRIAALAASMKMDSLTPESAIRQYSGSELDLILDNLDDARVLGILRAGGDGATLYAWVESLPQGIPSLEVDRLDALREIVTIGASAIGRIRAIEASVRARGLALVGRLASHYNHEARNQMSAILTLLEVLRDGHDSELSTAYREAVYQQALSLAENHNFALEVTRLRPERVSIAECGLAKLLQDTLLLFGGVFEREGITVVKLFRDTHALVLADANFLRQVLLNLLQNSVQALNGMSGGTITLMASEEKDTAIIEVRDNGPGIPGQVYDQLFTPWVTTKHDGTGLGLSFCQQSMSLMNGSISYDTPRGQPGARFILRLPVVNRLHLSITSGAAAF